MKKSLGALVLIISLCMMQSLWGRSVIDDSTKEEVPKDSLQIRRHYLETVRVIADYPRESIGSITFKPIEKGSTANPYNIKEALQSIAGIYASVGSKDESSIRIRGFRKNEVKIMIDGRPLNSGYFGNVDLNNLGLADISQIIVIKGPASALYGSNTMGGVINLITKNPNSEERLKLGFNIKRNNTHQMEFRSSRALDTWNYSIYGSRTHTDGFVLSKGFSPTYMENGGVRDNSKNTQYNISARINTEIMDYHAVGASANVSFMKQRRVPASIYERKYRLFKDWMRSSFTIMGDFKPEDQHNILAMIYYDAAKDTYQEYNDSGYQYLGVDSDMKNHTIGINPRWNWDLDANTKLLTGIRAEHIKNWRQDNRDYQSGKTRYLRSFQAYSQYEKYILENMALSVGCGISTYVLDEGNKYSTYLEPSAGLNWDFDNSTFMSFAIGRNSVYPTMRELYSFSNGNPDLEPQTAVKYELSLRHPLPFSKTKVTLGTSIYYNQIKNLIDKEGAQYQNIFRIDTYGGEWTLAMKPYKLLETDITYSYLAYHKSEDYTLTESPRNSFEFMNTLVLKADTKLCITSSYMDNRHSQDEMQRIHTLPAYWLHNIQINKRWKRYHLYFGLENLGDANYESEYGFPSAGINFNLGIEARL